MEGPIGSETAANDLATLVTALHEPERIRPERRQWNDLAILPQGVPQFNLTLKNAAPMEVSCTTKFVPETFVTTFVAGAQSASAKDEALSRTLADTAGQQSCN
jgi:hypothetical protein